MAQYEAPEAIVNEVDERGRALIKGAFSKTQIEVLDLISEGEIDGLVQGEYTYNGFLGEIGYRGDAQPVPFAAPIDNPNSPWLRSIYWNEVPLINSSGKYNFQAIDVSFTNGFPNGSLVNQTSPELTITRPLNERLRGLEYDSEQQPIESRDFSKIYRILNPACKAFIVNVKVHQLYQTLRVDEPGRLVVERPEDPNAHIGDVLPTEVNYQIRYRPIYSNSTSNNSPDFNFASPTPVTIKGKVTSPYVKGTRIELPPPNLNLSSNQYFIGWEIKITRTTEESTRTSLRNQTSIDSITEVYSDVFSYPHSAIIRQKFDAEYFSQVPERAFDVRLLKVKIPANYKPIEKQYDETSAAFPNGWDGTFKMIPGTNRFDKKWTDNPAWCFYDLTTNPRYGLGRYIENGMVDKWSLYEIGKFCDTLVEDGNGGIEPRFTCNLIINSREEAYKVMNDLASIFNGILYYAQGTIFPVQDSPKDPIVQFTNANVENGDFRYSSSSRRVRHTVAIVRYNDSRDFFKPAVEYVEDIEAIRKYGIRELELTAFGCTSRGQATRLGRWALLSESLETETINFAAGLEGAYLRPGDVFKVADSNRKIKRYAGRTYKIETGASSSSITLDDLITLNSTLNYKFSLLSPSYDLNAISVTDLTSEDFEKIRKSFLQEFNFQGSAASTLNGRTVIVGTPLNTVDFDINEKLIWTITLRDTITEDADSSQFIDEAYDFYRVIKIEEKEPNKFTVDGLQYVEDKYAKITEGLNFRPNVQGGNPPEVAGPPPPLQSPTALQLFLNTDFNNPTIDYSFIITNYAGITSYRVYIKRDDYPAPGVPNSSFLAANLPVETTFGNFVPSTAGTYYFRVFSADDNLGRISEFYAEGNITVPTTIPTQNIIIDSLQLAPFITGNLGGVRETGFYYNESPTFVWQAGVSAFASVVTDFKYVVTVRPPSNSNTPSPIVLFRETGLELGLDFPTYTFAFEKNLAASGGPYREYDVIVEAHDAFGRTSAGNNFNTGSGFSEVWTNSDGYDILNVINNRITGIFLSTGDRVVTSGFLTRQWMDANANIYVYFISGTTSGTSLPTGCKGGFIYHSTGQFQSNQITGNTPVAISTGEFDYDSKNKIAKIPSSLFGIRSGWIGVGLYDPFDLELKKRGYNISTGLAFTNVVSISPTGNYEKLAITNDLYFNMSEGSNVPITKLKYARSGTFNIFKEISSDGNEYIINSSSA